MNLHRTRSLPGISNNNKLNSALYSAVNVAPQHRHVQKPGNFILTNRQCKDSHFIYGVYTRYWFVHVVSLKHFGFLCLRTSLDHVHVYVHMCLHVSFLRGKICQQFFLTNFNSRSHSYFQFMSAFIWLNTQ